MIHGGSSSGSELRGCVLSRACALGAACLLPAGYKGASDLYIDANIQLALAAGKQVGAGWAAVAGAAGRAMAASWARGAPACPPTRCASAACPARPRSWRS